MADRANVAATFHANQCNDARFGYDWEDRWGDSSQPIQWTVDGITGTFWAGDRDCSSSIIDCWSEALVGTKYEGTLSGATYTGNMRSVFVDSGLFEWHPMGDGYVAQRGDIYLNEANHTAMCQSAVPDMLSEFSTNENGGAYGGQVGDQTGSEAYIHGYYDYPWDGILAYNHKADVNLEPTIETVAGFNDVFVTDYYADAIKYVSEKGIMTGYGDGSSFGPNDPLTRGQMAIILQRLGL